MVTVAVVGATGRLGRQVVRVVESMDGFEVVARLNSRSDLAEMDGADLVIDVSRHDVSNAVLDRAARNGQRILIGTSGWSVATLAAKNLPATVAVTVIPNFSVGSMVATHVSALVARYIPNARINETHHASKVDAPSGTSTYTAEAISAAREGSAVAPATDGVEAISAACEGSAVARATDGVEAIAATATPAATTPTHHVVAGVPITSHRLPDAIAEQTVTFAGNGETVTIRHETQSRDSYDAGIAASVRFAATSHSLTVGLDRVMGIQ